MEENQTNQNLNQQSAQSQPAQQQPAQAQSTIPELQPAQQPSVSMQIQQLLVQQQKYQQQYNQLVDYVKKTPNLPIEQVNQIKAQLDQLNALFVQWKQKLQALGYNQVQVNKPTNVKKWAKNNFSLKKLAIGCVVILVLILAWFFVTLTSLIKDPNALQWIWMDAANAKMILQAFVGLLFWSVILLMVGVIISNIYRLITVKNQSKRGYIWWLIGGLVWAWAFGALIGVTFGLIWKIEVVVDNIEYDLVQPYLVWRVLEVWNDEFNHPYDDDTMMWIGKNYPLIAPSEMAFSLRWNELEKVMSQVETNYQIVSIQLLCGDKDNTVLNLSHDVDKNNRYKFEWTCLYSEKWTYSYSVDIIYDNIVSRQRKTESVPWKSLSFTSEISLYQTSGVSSTSNTTSAKLRSTNWEFILWKAPAKITVDTTQIFRDFALPSYKVEWDMDWDLENDRVDQVKFDYSYNIPKIYHAAFNFPEISEDTWYRFPLRVEPSDIPVCMIKIDNFPWTTRYHITTEFMDPADSAKISSYNYTIKNYQSQSVLETLKNQEQEMNYTLPEQWSYVIGLDYVTVDGKQWRCESDVIQMKKEVIDVEYEISQQSPETLKFSTLCNSKQAWYNGCKEFSMDTMPQTYQLHIESITPYSTTMKKWVFLDNTPLLNDNNVYTFEIPSEWVYILKITTSDVSKWIEEETINITFTAKRQDIVGDITVTSSDTREVIREWFEPLSVILDASKTEVNVEWDEIVYFDWDFGDGETKRNQQNGVVAHTYRYDYVKENWIYQPVVKIITRMWREKIINGPKINVKKWLIHIDITSTSHPSRQAPVWKEVQFSAEFDWLPEKMTWDFGDGSDKIVCQWRTCTDISHVFANQWLFSVKLNLEFDAVQEVDGTITFKAY